MTSRRDFLKKAGLLSAAFAVPALNVNGDTLQSKIRLKNTKIAVDDRWDVIVIGGGPGGCTAAISAAREGAKTLLIEAMGQLGGMGNAGMVPAWCPFRMVRKSFIGDWRKRYSRHQKKECLTRENRS